MIVDARAEFKFLIDEKKYLNCVEVGVCEGDYAAVLAESRFEKLFLVDPWKYMENYIDIANSQDFIQEERYQKVKRRFIDDKRITLIRQTSLDAVKPFEDNQLDFVYLDGDHSYEAARDDINAWYKKIKSGGCLAGHDYLDGVLPQGIFGVKKAVDEFCNNNKFELHVTREPDWRSWYIFKK